MDKILKASCELLLAIHDDMNYVNLEHYVTTKKHWKVVLYHTKPGDDLLKRLSITCDLFQYSRENTGFAYRTQNINYIFIDGNLDELERLRILVHEIGHIMLGHLETCQINASNRTQNEIDANTFVKYVLNPKKSDCIKYRILNFRVGIFAILAVAICICIGILTLNPGTGTNAVISPKIGSNTVYVTPSGDKYHTKDCRYIDEKTAVEIPIEKARQSYAPCSVCKPND